MNKQKTILFALTILMIGGGGAVLAHFHGHQQLGKPGVRTRPLAGSHNLEVILPEHVLDYESEPIPLAEIVTNTLPPDTSFGQRLYKGPDGFQILNNVVLMGTDRTSLHKPQFCLEGSGWTIDQAATTTLTIPMQKPVSYDLPVVKLHATRSSTESGQPAKISGVYVYYYVDEDQISATTSGFQRMWWMARDVIRTGVLQRWAYITYFAQCLPGQEEATLERMIKFITTSAPEFQLVPRPPEATITARQ